VSGNGKDYKPSKDAKSLEKDAPGTNAAAKGSTAAAGTAAQQSSSRFGSIMRNVGLLAGGMFLGSMLANLFGMGGFMGDVLGLLANIFMFGAVFMLLRWAWNKFRGNSNSSYSGGSWQRPSEPVDVTPRENQRPVYQDISRIPSGDYDAKTTADRYRNR
jgi:predicted lipid-binding transport protein (Tim44 family)